MERNTARQDGSEPHNDEMSLLDLIGVLWRRKILILCITAASVVGVLAYTVGSLLLPAEKSYMPNVFTPKAVMLVSDQNSGGLAAVLASSSASGLASLAGINPGGPSNGNIAILIAKSKTTLDDLDAEFGLSTRYKIEKNVKAETRKAILAHLRVSFDDKTSALTVEFTDVDPVLAQKVVNKLVEILDNRFASLGGNKALKQKDLLEAKIADVDAQTKRLENDIKAFTARNGIIDVEALATEQITVMAQLRSELIMKELEIENYQKFSTIDDPVVRRMKSERDSLQAKLVELDQGTNGSALPAQRQTPALAFEFAALQRDLAVQTELYKILTQQYELAKLNVEGQDPVFQVLELAEVPDSKSGPRRALICLFVSLGGFLFSVLAAFSLDAIDRVRRDPDALRRLRGIE